MDREKVISWVEGLAEDDWRLFHSDSEVQNIAKSALALLKEQEPVEPGIAQDVDGIFATCGNCKKKLWKMMGLEFVVNPDEMPRFCPHCGRSVKWSADD